MKLAKVFMSLFFLTAMTACGSKDKNSGPAATDASSTLFGLSIFSTIVPNKNSLMGLWESNEVIDIEGTLTLRLKFESNRVISAARCKIDGVTLYSQITASGYFEADGDFVVTQDAEKVTSSGDKTCSVSIEQDTISQTDIKNGKIYDSGLVITKISD